MSEFLFVFIVTQQGMYCVKGFNVFLLRKKFDKPLTRSKKKVCLAKIHLDKRLWTNQTREVGQSVTPSAALHDIPICKPYC